MIGAPSPPLRAIVTKSFEVIARAEDLGGTATGE